MGVVVEPDGVLSDIEGSVTRAIGGRDGIPRREWQHLKTQMVNDVEK